VRSELVVTAPRLFLCLSSGLDVLSALVFFFFLSVAVTFVIALRTPLPATGHVFQWCNPATCIAETEFAEQHGVAILFAWSIVR
jgi:hypothetical protein